MKHRIQQPKTKNLGTCSNTFKKCYTRKDAIVLAKYMRRNFETNITEYRCQSCNEWHIGSQVKQQRSVVALHALRSEVTADDSYHAA